jgi:hypothetical protein
LKRFLKIFPIETDVNILDVDIFTILWPLTNPWDHGLNEIDSTLCQVKIREISSFYGTVVHKKITCK